MNTHDNNNKLNEFTDELMTVKELCLYLKMSWNTIQAHYFKYEKFPKEKIGHKWCFDKKKLILFLDEYFEDETKLKSN
jgi:phage pi2 protein 07